MITVTANGGVITSSGAFNIAVAASSHSVPLVICAGVYKFSPVYPFNTDKLNIFSNPDPAYSFEDSMAYLLIGRTWTSNSKIPKTDNDRITLLNPEFDFIPPNLLSLYITDEGPYPPFMTKKLLTENYGEDYDSLRK
jgi:translation initiation factor eIF-2B subunit beta